MFRKSIALVASLAAIVVLVLGLYGYRYRLHWDASVDNQRWCHFVVLSGSVIFAYADPDFMAFRGVLNPQSPREGAALPPITALGLHRDFVRQATGEMESLLRPDPEPTGRPTRELVVKMEQYEASLKDQEIMPLFLVVDVLRAEQFIMRATASPSRAALIRFPLWVPFLLLAAYPVSASVRSSLRRLRRYRRRRKGLCLTCGYDLRGSVSGVCSECGEPARELEERTANGR